MNDFPYEVEDQKSCLRIGLSHLEVLSLKLYTWRKDHEYTHVFAELKLLVTVGGHFGQPLF